MVELIFLSHPLGILARLGHKNTLDPLDVSSLYIFHSVISACSWWWQGWVRRADPTKYSGVWFLLKSKYQCLQNIGNKDDVVKAVKPSALDSDGGAVTASFSDLGTSLTCCACWLRAVFSLFWGPWESLEGPGETFQTVTKHMIVCLQTSSTSPDFWTDG